jgi:hypothetical protein
MQVDHVIPESLQKDSAALSATLDRYGLDASFDICGYENLAPSCPTCNKRKLHNPFPIGQIAIFLTQIAAKVSSVKKNVSGLEKARTLNSILRSVANAIDKGRFSKTELREALEKEGYLDFMVGSGTSGTIRNSPAWAVTPKHTEIRYSRHALQRVAERGLILDELEVALRGGTARASRSLANGRVVYELGTPSGLRIVYTISDDVLSVITAYRRAR